MVWGVDGFWRIGDTQTPSNFDGHDHQTGTEAPGNTHRGFQENGWGGRLKNIVIEVYVQRYFSNVLFFWGYLKKGD